MPSIPSLSRSHQHRIETKYNVVTEYPNLRLHSAAAKGDIGSVQYALTHGQPANSVLDGILPLHAACSGGSELVVKLLIDFGADVNAPRLPRRYSDKKSEGGTIIGSSGSTPLHFAAANGHAAIIKILLQRGADPTRADKYGTKPETLASNFRHEECAQILRDWEAAHPPEAASTNGGPTTVPLPEGPPSPSKSRKLQVKRSLENLLTRKGLGITPAQPPSNAALSPFMTFGQGIDSGTASPFGGVSTPASSSSEAFAPIPASGARRPSLPHIFETPAPTPTRKGSLRPRSAGQGAEEANTMPGAGQKRIASKISLLNIFKKDTSTSNPAALGTGYTASSPNLLEFLAQPVEPGIRTRQRNSIDEPRITGNPGPSRGSLDRGDRERHSPPTTAPPQRTLFFNPAASVFHTEDQEDLPPLPSVMLPRTSRSNSQTRGAYPDYRTRTDSNVTMTSTGSSMEAQQNPASYAIQNNWARAKRDRSASEGAGALGKRSPLMNEWGRDDEGNIVDKELPGVIADEEDEDSAGSGTPAPNMSTSPEQYRSIERERKVSKPPQLPEGPRRPSLTNGGTGGSSGTYSPAEHKRTNSTQSTKNLRFDLPAGDGPTQRSVSTAVQPTGRPQVSPSTTTPPSPLAPKKPKKSLRTSSSAGSLPKSKPSSSSSDRPFSAGGERTGKQGRIGTAERRPSTLDDSFEDEDHIAAEEAEGGDSFGELVPRIPTARSGSMSSGYSARPPLQALASPATPTSGISTLYSPTSASTVSAGGRPWAYPETANTSLTSLPSPANAAAKSYSSLSVKGGTTGAEGDSRLRGASVSSSKSTDTSASSANVATTTTSSSNGASDSSSTRQQGQGWSTSASTASAGTTGRATIRAPKLGPIATGATVYRSPYEIDDYDSSSSAEKYTKDSTPLPVLLRSVNSHAQAHALVEKAEKQILDLADLPPDSAGLSDEALSAQLAAFGETLALERRFAKGEAQKSAWLSRKGYADDSDEEEITPDDEKNNRSPLRDTFAPQTQRKGSSGTMPSMSPVLHRAGSLEFNKTIKQATVRARPTKSRTTPVKSNTTPLSAITPIRTTPSNVGPPPTDIKPGRRSEDLQINQLVMHGIEITKTLPTPTDSPRSNVDFAAAQSASRNVGVDEAAEPQDRVVASPPELQITPVEQRNPDITVSEFQTVPLSRVSTAPSPHEKSMTVPNFSQVHGRTVSSGNPVVLQGPDDYYPPRSESRQGGKHRFGGLRNLVQTLKGK